MREYLPTLADLIDRLSIIQLKEVFIPEHKEEYAEEIKLIVHDIQLILDENTTVLTAEIIRDIIIVSQYNCYSRRVKPEEG